MQAFISPGAACASGRLFDLEDDFAARLALCDDLAAQGCWRRSNTDQVFRLNSDQGR